MPRYSFNTHFAGFTLAELLIALAILGVIATFSIPKLLNAQQDGRKIAIFREDIAAVQQVMFDMIRDGTFVRGKTTCGSGSPTFSEADFVDRINAIQKPTGSPWQMYLSNGSRIDLSKGDAIDFTIDYNGDTDPNTIGEDRITIYFNHASITCHTIPPMRFGPNWNNGYGALQPANDALYYEIFSN